MSELKDKRILYVEDDQATREVLAKFIKQRVGKLYLAASGEEGLEQNSECKPHIVIADLIMPGISGLEMIEKIKAENKECKVLITSTVNEVNTVIEAMDLGIDHYIIKPIDTEELVLKLEKLARTIEESGKEKGNAIFFDKSKNLKIFEEGIRRELLGIIKQKSGKGPQDIKVIFFDNSIEVFFKDAFTTIEKTITENKRNIALSEQYRRVFYEAIAGEIENSIDAIVGNTVTLSAISVDSIKRIDKITLTIV